MQLDLGGIAKGYAADEGIAVLKKHGITRALVAAGGDIAVSGPPPDADGWKIAIAPLKEDDARKARTWPCTTRPCPPPATPSNSSRSTASAIRTLSIRKQASAWWGG